MMKSLLFVLTISFTLNGITSEVDSFTQRRYPLIDETSRLNTLTNKWLKQSTKSLKSCNPADVKMAIKKKFNKFGWSKFENFVVNHKSIEKHISTKNHVYSGFKKTNSPTIIDLPRVMSPSLKIANVYIGADKFSHFFNEGYNYSNKRSFEDAIEYGASMERSFWGLLTTGIYSYADLSANYQGYKFFNELTKGKKPYFKCRNNQWVKVRFFDWRNYVDDSWDEGINCNDFRTDELEDAFHKKINVRCPITPRKCEFLRKKYASMSDHLISPKCR